MEQQRQGVAYQPEFDFTTQAEWTRPLGGGEGAIPIAAPKREQQVFAAWKEELNWDERLLEAIADPGNLRRAYRKVKSNGGAKMAEHIRVLLSEEEVNERIRVIAEQISKAYAGKEIHMICVLKGGVFFMCELAKRIDVPVSLDFMAVSSYGGDTKSSGVIKIVKDLDESIQGKDRV